MISRLRYLVLLLAVSWVWSAALATGQDGSAAADFYIATSGSDRWSGTLSGPNAERTDGPFASLARARDAVRQLADRSSRDITVLVRGGVYRLEETVVFSRQDSAGAGHRIVYAAYPGESPVFSGGRPFRNWQRPTALPKGVTAAARAHIWSADVSDRAAFRTLFDGEGRLPRARSRGFSPVNTTPRGSKNFRNLEFAAGQVHSYHSTAGLELRVVPCFFWTMNLIPIQQIDLQKHLLITAVDATYPVGRNGMTDRDNAWIENGIEDLDEPGEWVVSDADKRVYYWPVSGRPGGSVVAPVLTELLRVEGQINYGEPKDLPVSGIEFRGLTFMHGDRYAWHGRTGWGLQHDWECFDKPTGLVRLRGAEQCAIERCEFKASGHTAIRLDLHCQRNRVSGNHIHHIGGVGVLLAGYGPGTKDVNRANQVIDNHIHDIGLEYWASGAIFAWQSGENEIAHNYIHHTPYTAILATGRIVRTVPGPAECSRTIRWDEVPKAFRTASWAVREPFLHARRNRIEYNEIHDAMQMLGDGNCIYVSGAGGGNVVRGNYCHHCYGPYMNAVIRCDDDQHQTLIEHNICYRTGGYGEGIISKGDNDILNNVIADLRPGKRHRGYIVFPYGSIKGTRIKGNILLSCGLDQVLYYFGPSSTRRGAGPRLQDAEMNRNVYYCTRDAHWADAHLQAAHALGLETDSIQADPEFVDIGGGDFQLAPTSPARQRGIQPLDTNQTGLQDATRARLLGRRLRTRINAADQVLRHPVHVQIASSDSAATIRYTLDGSMPTVRSREFEGEILISRPSVLRARSFALGASDFVGARVVFAAPPQPLIEGFEEAASGSTAPRATTDEDPGKPQYAVRVTARRAVTGKHSLEFTCGPGQQRSFTPHIYYRCRYTEGRIRGRFAAWLEPDAAFSYQWRDYREAYRHGPSVTIEPGGKLVHQGRVLATLPTRCWLRFEVIAECGKSAPRQFDLLVHLPDKSEPRRFKELGFDAQFQRLDWVGFASHAKRPTAYFVDDIEIRPE